MARAGYRISRDPDSGRSYLGASWTIKPMAVVPVLAQPGVRPVLGVYLNAYHLAVRLLDTSGNPMGKAISIALELKGLPASTRDGHLAGALAELVRIAKANNAALAVEDLGWAAETGRDQIGGKRFRHTVSSMPTAKVKVLLSAMASRAGVRLIAVDPAYTSVWGGEHWQQSLNTGSYRATRHDGAATVIGRRAQGFGARRREDASQADQWISMVEWPTRSSNGIKGPGTLDIARGHQAGSVPPKRPDRLTVRAGAPGRVRPFDSTVVEEMPSTVVEEMPSTVVEEMPSTVVEEMPSTVVEEMPSTNSSQTPSSPA